MSMDFFDELILQLKKEAVKGDSFTVSPETWEIFLDPAKAVKKVEKQAPNGVKNRK